MNWNSAYDFFAMGGYGLYVWGSYAVALVLMVIEPVLARQRQRRAWREAVEQAAAPRSQR